MIKLFTVNYEFKSNLFYYENDKIIEVKSCAFLCAGLFLSASVNTGKGRKESKDATTVLADFSKMKESIPQNYYCYRNYCHQN
ncbi:hypothetical protein CS542_05495 [Pedobacter sp. IW39]|nr:hypothetical protein CS542_05495 [Pedobacter sp. IW39]